MYGDMLTLSYCGDHFAICTNTESLCNTPETNVLLYVSYTSIKQQGNDKTKLRMALTYLKAGSWKRHGEGAQS